MKISRGLLLDLTHGDQPDAQPWIIVEDENVGEWRWGIERRIILQHGTDLWGYTYRVSIGDEYYNSIEDQPEEVELHEVVDEIECKTVYRFKIRGVDDAVA